MPIREVVHLFLKTEGPRLEHLYLLLALRKSEALPVVEEELRTGTPMEKRKITKLLRYLGWPELVPTLLEIASSDDEHWLSRRGCIYALAGIGDRSAGPALMPLLGKPQRGATETRIIIAALATLQCREAVPAIRDYVGHEDILVRIYATRALRDLGEDPDMELLFEASRADDYVVRSEAATALGAFGGDRAAQVLEALAKRDPISAVRDAARIALLRIAVATMSNAVRVRLLENAIPNVEDRVASWVISFLARECGSDGISALRRLASEDSSVGAKSTFHLLTFSGAGDNSGGGY